MDILQNLLQCSRCNKELPPTDFPVNNSKPARDFRGNTCLSCQRRYKKTLNYSPCLTPILCTKCDVVKEAEEFSRNKRLPKGRNSVCKPCKNLINKKGRINEGTEFP